jgi:hypothetical protein
MHRRADRSPGRRLAAFLPTLALLAAVYAVCRYAYGAGIVDDAYIFLRYARNFAEGQGLVFNPGERVEGYTSPLWTFLLCGLTLARVDMPLATAAFSALLGFATIAIVFVSLRNAGPRSLLPALTASLLLATDPAVVFWSASGMETALLGLLLLLGFLSFRSRLRSGASLAPAGLWCALGALTRLEALAVPAIYAVAARRRGRAIGPLLAPLLVVPLHLAWRRLYYGAFLPNTFYAKMGSPVAQLSARGAAYAGRFVLAYAPLGIALAVARLSRRSSSREAAAAGPGIAAAVLAVWTALVIAMGGDHFSLFRFLAPLLPLLVWLLADAAIRLPPPRRAAVAVALVVAAIAGQAAWVYVFFGGEAARNEVEIAREWADVGVWFRDHAPPDATLALEVVGAIPYESRLRTLDMMGLTDRFVATHGRIHPEAAIGHQKYATDYILSRRPDYIVFRTAGWYDEPVARDAYPISMEYDYALFDLTRDPRLKLWYAYGSARMDNGRWVEFLHLKPGAR